MLDDLCFVWQACLSRTSAAVHKIHFFASYTFFVVKNNTQLENNRKGSCDTYRNPLKFLVGMKGFEPSTPWTPFKCAPRLRYIPTQKNLYFGLLFVNEKIKKFCERKILPSIEDVFSFMERRKKEADFKELPDTGMWCSPGAYWAPAGGMQKIIACLSSGIWRAWTRKPWRNWLLE